jgi:hypothetical protein
MSYRNTRLNYLLGVSSAACAAALLAAPPAAYAQTTATLQGQVVGAGPGATVTAVNVSTGQRATTRTDSEGRFTIVGLRPSAYTVSADGAEAKQVVLPVGQTINVELFTAAAVEEVVVVGGQRRQEVRTATIGTNVSTQQMETLPQNDRNFLNFAALAPGVTVSNDPNNKRIQAGGVSSENVNVYIDGSSHKNQVGFGGVAGQNFSQGNPFPQSAVQEFRVETQNYKAEFEQAGSAIITAVTKTGGTEFHGGIFGQYVPKKWYGRPFFDRPGEANNPNPPYREKPDYKRLQFGADLSGPIIPGKLHFFAGYEATRQTNPSIAVNLTDPAVPAAIREANSGDQASDFKQDLWFGKLSLFATEADTINFSYFKREESDIKDYGGTRIREGGRDVGTASENYQLEWTHRGENWVNELIINRFSNFTGTPTVTTGPEYKLTNANGGEILIAGANSFQQANDQTADTLRNNFTYTGFEGHVIKAGIRISDTTLTRVEDVFANGSYVFAAAGFQNFQTSIPYRAQISLRPPTPIVTDNMQYGLFIQDDWTIDQHWTVNFGLRWDYESNNFNNKFVTPEKVATALRNYQPWKVAGINAEDYINDGSRREPFKGAFQPRLGVSYDVNGDRDLVFFAGAGRYYDRNIFYLASLETLFQTIRSDVTVQFCDAPGSTTACPPAGAPQGNVLRWNNAYRDPAALRAAVPADLSGDIWAINNDVKVPYTDQFTVGVRKRFFDWQVSAALAHNRSRDAFIYVRGNRQPNGQYTDAGFGWIRDNFPVEGRPAGYTGRLNIGSSNGQQRYTALYLTAEKAYTEASGWGATASLTVSKAESNQGRVFGEAEMFNAGSQDAFGWQRTGGLEDWRFVGTGIKDLPWGLTLSGTLTLSSGPAFGHVDFSRGVPGCNGCVYFNEGGVFTPKDEIAYKTLDLRVSKTFDLPGGQAVVADFQAFNVFDWVNRAYSTWGAGSGANPPLEENNTVGYARTFQAGLKYRF